MVDASWSPAKDKIEHLQADTALKKLKAVQNNAFIVVPFSETIPGVRNVTAVTDIADDLAALPAG